MTLLIDKFNNLVFHWDNQVRPQDFLIVLSSQFSSRSQRWTSIVDLRLILILFAIRLLNLVIRLYD